MKRFFVSAPAAIPHACQTLNPTISILTATLDAGDALRRTRDSIAEQSCPPHEWIVKDGGSTDGSIEALVPPPRTKLRVVRTPDTGIFDALNQAIEAATADYIHVLPAGDTFASPEALETAAAALRNAARPDLLHCSVLHEPSGTLWTHPPRLTRWFLFRGTICHQAQFWSRSVLQSLGGFDVSLKIAADREFLVRACARASLRTHRIDQTLIHYAGGGVSESPKNAGRLLGEVAEIRRRHFHAAERVGFSLLSQVTFPGLRARWNDRPPRGPGSRAYRRVRSWVRRYI